MKYLQFYMVIFLLISNCSSKPEINELDGKWHLQNVSGGFAGVNIDFEKGQVIWDFQSEKNSFRITENFENDDPNQNYTPLKPGQYNYEIIVVGNKKFLQLEGLENTIGAYEITNNGQLVINPNEQPTGQGADHFISLFSR